MENKQRSRKKGLLWLILGSLGCSGCGIAVFVISLILLMMLLTTIIMKQKTNLSEFATPAPGSSLLLNLPTHNWKGLANELVVAEALHIAAALYDGPPDNYDTWYNASQIPDAITYWQQACAGCSTWVQGNLQCGMFVAAAYGLAKQTMPYFGATAIDLYTSGVYLNKPGWAEETPETLPLPGDIIILSGPHSGADGHVAIVDDIQLPADGQAGYVQFVQANGPGAINQEPLAQDGSGFHMEIWANYTVVAYLRHITALTTS